MEQTSGGEKEEEGEGWEPGGGGSKGGLWGRFMHSVKSEEIHTTEEKTTGKNRKIWSFFSSVHHVSLSLPVDPQPEHMSALQSAYVSTITW